MGITGSFQELTLSSWGGKQHLFTFFNIEYSQHIFCDCKSEKKVILCQSHFYYESFKFKFSNPPCKLFCFEGF